MTSLQECKVLSPPICRCLSIGANFFLVSVWGTSIFTSLCPITQRNQKARDRHILLEARGLPTHSEHQAVQWGYKAGPWTAVSTVSMPFPFKLPPWKTQNTLQGKSLINPAGENRFNLTYAQHVAEPGNPSYIAVLSHNKWQLCLHQPWHSAAFPPRDRLSEGTM